MSKRPWVQCCIDGRMYDSYDCRPLFVERGVERHILFENIEDNATLFEASDGTSAYYLNDLVVSVANTDRLIPYWEAAIDIWNGYKIYRDDAYLMWHISWGVWGYTEGHTDWAWVIMDNKLTYLSIKQEEFNELIKDPEENIKRGRPTRLIFLETEVGGMSLEAYLACNPRPELKNKGINLGMENHETVRLTTWCGAGWAMDTPDLIYNWPARVQSKDPCWVYQSYADEAVELNKKTVETIWGTSIPIELCFPPADLGETT